MPRLSIRGIQEAQRANVRWVAALRPSGRFGRAIQFATIQAHRYAVSITHVQTGSLRASHRMHVSSLRGEIFIDPAAINPRSRLLTSKYGPVEHGRGGSHAFYARTEIEAGDRISRAAAAGMMAGVP